MILFYPITPPNVANLMSCETRPFKRATPWSSPSADGTSITYELSDEGFNGAPPTLLNCCNACLDHMPVGHIGSRQDRF